MYNPSKLTGELQKAGLPVESVTPDEVFYSREISQEEQATADAIIAAHDPADYAAQRQTAAVSEASLAGVLKTVTPEEAVNFINNNVTDLASAKVALKLIARLLIAIRDYVMPELPDK